MKVIENDLEKIIQFDPAWDRRDPRPSKNYGVHGVEINFILRGPHGATSFRLFTHWMLPHVVREQVKKYTSRALDEGQAYYLLSPMPADLGFHSVEPVEYATQMDYCTTIYDDSQEAKKGCWYDGSGLQAEQLFEEFVAKGEDVIWERLGQNYTELFLSTKEDS